MEALTTPAARFEHLPGWPWPMRVWRGAATAGLAMAYVDVGPASAERVFLCLHGNPTWSYLYRHMIPVFEASGARVVAPDLLGFGRSDKPLEESAHSFEFHRRSLQALIEALDLRRVTLVVQDWGGILGLTLPMALPARFERVLLMNTTFGTGEVSGGFRAWRSFSNARPDLEVGKLLARSEPRLSAAEAAAYDAPFPDARHKAALRAFPKLVPDGADAPGAALSRDALQWWRSHWQGASFMAIGMKDPVLGEPTMLALREAIPGCPEPLRLADAGHFTPEHGAGIARAALAAWD
jgi:pimeloyl-ACP methyl ester carboxylesterase